MTLDFDDTKSLISGVINAPREIAQVTLNSRLITMERTIGEFYDGVIEHGPFMDYTSDQWLDFHQKIPHWRLQREKALMKKLSPKQRESLVRYLAP